MEVHACLLLRDAMEIPRARVSPLGNALFNHCHTFPSFPAQFLARGRFEDRKDCSSYISATNRETSSTTEEGSTWRRKHFPCSPEDTRSRQKETERRERWRDGERHGSSAESQFPIGAYERETRPKERIPLVNLRAR